MKTLYFEWQGRMITKKDMQKMTGWSSSTIDRRIHDGWTIDQILNYAKEGRKPRKSKNDNPCADKTIYDCTHCKRSRCIYDDIRRNKK